MHELYWSIIEVHTKIQIAMFCLIRLWDVLNEEVIDENHISNTNFFLLPWTSSTNDTIYHSWYTKHMHLIILFSLLSINFYFSLISSSMLVCGYWRLQVFNSYVLGLDHIGYHGNMGCQISTEEIQNQTVTHTKVIGIAPSCQKMPKSDFQSQFWLSKSIWISLNMF